MINEMILKENLLKCLKNEEVAFQYCDELIDFTFPGNVSAKASLIKDVENNRVCLVDDRSHKPAGLEDMFEWATPSDILVMVNEHLVLCLPGKSRDFLVD